MPRVCVNSLCVQFWNVQYNEVFEYLANRNCYPNKTELHLLEGYSVNNNEYILGFSRIHLLSVISSSGTRKASLLLFEPHPRRKQVFVTFLCLTMCDLTMKESDSTMKKVLSSASGPLLNIAK